MALSQLGITKLSSMPNIKMLLLKAALKRSRYDRQSFSDTSLPERKLGFDGFQLDEPTYRLYHQVVDWGGESEIIHPCYLHSLAFPLHIMLLLLPEFPFPLLGLVHVNNQISQLRPIRRGDKLAATSCFGPLELHPKGWLFSIKVEFYCGTELVWQSVSTNLFRTNHGHAVDPIAKYSTATVTNPINTTWDLSASLGRRYAKVSGDFNPIHLTKWTAKLFGFKQHIIHGMWTKSYCVSALQKISPKLFSQAFEFNTSFKQPLYLPSQVNMAVQPLVSSITGDEQHFQVLGIRGNNEQSPLHLIGHIRAI
jgi:hypothetical protein